MIEWLVNVNTIGNHLITTESFIRFFNLKLKLEKLTVVLIKEAKKCSCFFNAFWIPSLFLSIQFSLSLSLSLSATPKTTTLKTLSMDRWTPNAPSAHQSSLRIFLMYIEQCNQFDSEIVPWSSMVKA